MQGISSLTTMSKRIYYHDTDSGGVVYYANYLKYFEEGRTEFMRGRGADVKELSKQGILFVVRNVQIDYKSPARYNEELSIITSVIKVKNVSFIFQQEAKREDTVLVTAQTTLVCIDEKFHPIPIPNDVSARIIT